MQENIELKVEDKVQLKIISAKLTKHMKDLIIDEAHEIIDNNDDIPLVKREVNRTSLIIKLDDDFKEEIRTFCDIQSVRIRDFWVECVNRIIKRYENEDSEAV